MLSEITRRSLFVTAGGVLLSRKAAFASNQTPVALTRGDNRRHNITAALEAIDDQIRPKLAKRKSVVIKPNLVSTNKQLAATHVDALNGILDYLETRWKGPVFIAESSAGHTPEGYETFGYAKAVAEHRKLNVKMIDLNEEELYQTIHLLNADLQITPVRLAARLCDPDAFVISSAMLKTHNTVVATLNVKNLTLGAPLHSKLKATPRFNDKRVYHGGVRQTHYDMMLTAQKLSPTWGLAVIDGYEGMEGNGPSQGTPVNHKIAIASTDYIACDRIGVGCMGIDPAWMGYLEYCGKVGVGTWDRANIELRGEKVENVQIKYRMHADLDRELQWRGPLTELPPKLG